jgi:RND family efflux transporter MFP subunit
MQKLGKMFGLVRRQPLWRIILALVILGALGIFVWGRGGKSASKTPVFTARRGPLEITVMEGGSMQALESQEVKCEVRVGYQGTKILRIVEEGYFVTEDDVKTNKVLVELDSSDLQKQIVQQEISFQSALAALINAQQNYEIQINQNASDIKAAEQKARFARMDFDKLLGDSVTTAIVQEVGLDKLLAEATTNNVENTSRAQEVANENKTPAPGTPPLVMARNSQALPATDANCPTNADGSPKIILANANTNGPTASQVTNGLGQLAIASKTVILATNGLTKVEPGAASPPVVLASNTSTPGETTPGTVPPGALKPGQTLGSGPMPILQAGASEDLSNATENDLTNSIQVDFSKYADLEKLGDGESKQKLRKFYDDLQVAQKELGQAKTTLDGTQRLFEKDFVTKTDLQRDEIAYENSRLKVVTAESARDLFLKYDFVKSAEEALSKYAEAVRELDKARRLAVSKLAQARANLKSAQGQHQVQLRQLNDFKEQLAKCTLTAKKSGLVVYGSANEDMFFYGGEERIREGATVRERQTIITIPDMSRMAVKVKIHETYIKKVKKGQKARITVDAYPDKTLNGEVSKVGVLPDSQNRWMNPDMKVYLTTITLEGTADWVKPGMSAKVEILVDKIDNCVYVPVQAVSPDGDKQVCYIAGIKPERREVQIGEFNDSFIEIKKGLGEGERVLLRPPEGREGPKPANEGKPGEPGKTKPAAPSTVPTTAPVQAAKT